MTLKRREFIAVAGGGVLGAMAPGLKAQTTTGLKISHQFPGGTLTEGDFRDRLCQRFAAEVEKANWWSPEVFGLCGLVADEDQCPIFIHAKGRA